MYELLPFWHTLFTRLGFKVTVSPFSNRKLYQSGQATIPSDTACFPAKLSHGHIRWLCEQGVDAVFYPCMSYNLDEHLGDNHYNCPVVAYYPEVLAGQLPRADQDPAHLRLLRPAPPQGLLRQVCPGAGQVLPRPEQKGCACRHRCRL